MRDSNILYTISHKRLLGIFLILIDALLISMYYVCLKFMTGAANSGHVVCLCKIGCFISILPFVLRKGLKFLKTYQLSVHIMRAFFSTLASLFLAHSFSLNIGLTDSNSIQLLEKVFWVIASILFFKDNINIDKILAITLGFIGALAVTYPGFLQFKYPFIDISVFSTQYNLACLYTLLAVFCWTLNSVCVKMLGIKKEKNETQLFYGLLFSSIIAFLESSIQWSCLWDNSLCIASNKWINISLDVNDVFVKYYLIAVICYSMHMASLFAAMKLEKMSILAPYTYFKLIFSAILAYIILNEMPNPMSYVGYILIILSGAILLKSKLQNK